MNVECCMPFSQVTNTPEFRILKEKKFFPYENHVSLYIATEDGLNLVRRGGYAYLSDVAAAYMYIRKNFEPNQLCDINEVNLRAKVLLGFFSNKQSPYKEMLKCK